MNDEVVRITDSARAVLALAEELDRVDAEIKKELNRHQFKMEALKIKQHALHQAIFQYGAN